MKRILRYAIYLLTIAGVLAFPAGTPNTLEFKVYREAYRDYFNVVTWMAQSLTAELFGRETSSLGTEQSLSSEDGSEVVKRYLKLNEQIAAAAPRASSRAQPGDTEGLQKLVEERDGLEPRARSILRRQVEEVLREEGLTSTTAGREGVFPPPLFAFTPLPKILVVSPRSTIRTATTLALRPDLKWSEAEAVEKRVDTIGVSTLVVPIGGLGAYPPMLPRTSSLESLVHTIPHEWAHNYFTLHPLGFRYTLQLEKDYEVVTMNESAASIIGEEIGDRVLSKYYGYPRKEHPRRPPPKREPQQLEPAVESDFNKRMRAIRLKVDDHLSKGQIAEAEQYMTDEQKKLQADGYDVRKLNQAYFAFYGSYATSPGFTNPLGEAVVTLRYRSPSLKAFVDQIGEMRSSGELKKALPDN